MHMIDLPPKAGTETSFLCRRLSVRSSLHSNRSSKCKKKNMSGLTCVKPNRADYSIILVWYNYGNYLAVTPVHLQGRIEKKLRLFPTLYPIVLFTFYLGATIFSFYERFYLYEHFNISQELLDAVQGVTELCLIESIVLASIFKRRNWKKFMGKIAKMEQKVSFRLHGSVNDADSRMIKSKVFLYHLVYIAVHGYDTFANWKHVSYSLAFVVFRFTTYYNFFTMFFVTCSCGWLKNRYLFLKSLLKDALLGKRAYFVVPGNGRRCAFENPKEFSRYYKMLYLIVQDFNALFGTQIFLIAICTVLEILNGVNYGMPTSQNKPINGDVIFINIIFPVLYIVSNTLIVMSCDSVEKCAQDITRTCLILYESSEKQEMKEEFLKLANFTKGLRPRFSAGGFWPVNQMGLSTMFYSVITYIMIIIQFNMTLE